MWYYWRHPRSSDNKTSSKEHTEINFYLGDKLSSILLDEPKADSVFNKMKIWSLGFFISSHI